MAEVSLLDRVALGDHVCWVVDDDRVRLDTMADFVSAGLRARHQVFYAGDAPEDVLAGIEWRGVAVRPALRTGQLAARTAESCYLPGGSFDAAATIRLFRETAARARDQGYAGLRVIGDMSWAHREAPGAEQLAWYETQVNTVFPDGLVMGVCAYDRRLFDPRVLRGLSWAHHGTVDTGIPYDPRSSLRLRSMREPYGLRLSGEADLANRAALHAVIERLFEEPGEDEPSECPIVTVDVSELRFADTAATRILVRAAAVPGRRRLRLVGCSPALVRLLDFHNAAAVPGLIIEASR